MMVQIFILEYSEEQRLFHFNFGDSKENTFGWKTLGNHTWEECVAFSDYMKTKYKNTEFPAFDEVKKEYSLFFK